MTHDDDSDNTGKFIALILLVVLGGGYLGYVGIKHFLSGLAEKYTDTQPVALPAIEAADSEVQEVVERVNEFARRLEHSQEPVELSLSARDINILINRHPDWRELAGKVHVIIEDDRIKGTVSLPLDEIGGPLAGRYLNGFAVFRVGTHEDQLEVFIESIEMNGEPLPDVVIHSMSSVNLAQETDMDPESEAMLRRVQSLDIRDGRLHMVIGPGDRNPGQ